MAKFRRKDRGGSAEAAGGPAGQRRTAGGQKAQHTHNNVGAMVDRRTGKAAKTGTAKAAGVNAGVGTVRVSPGGHGFVALDESGKQATGKTKPVKPYANMSRFSIIEQTPGGERTARAVPSDEAERILRLESGRRLFASDAEMAEWFRVDRSRITRWRAGVPMEAENLELLRRIDAVVAALDGFYEPEVIPQWLRGVNAFLGSRQPLFVLRHGLLSDVIRAIEAEKSGAFA